MKTEPGQRVEPLIYELSRPGRCGVRVPAPDVPEDDDLESLPETYRRKDLSFPEVSQVDVVRHFTRLSSLNYHVDRGLYPLGSCTMKYNPKINDRVASMPGFSDLHPLLPDECVQGLLEILFSVERYLASIAGMAATTLCPAAGAHGELTALIMARAWQASKDRSPAKVIVPDSAHGTNPASASMCGYQVVEVSSNSRGCIDVEHLERVLGDDVALVMLTNPNTLGLFEEDICRITRMCHDAGSLVYCDGANSNALMGYARPGDMGFDLMHFNLHKTFSTPHGGGGPGAGAVCAAEELEPFLPTPRLERGEDGLLHWTFQRPQSVGPIISNYGNVGNVIRCWAYIRSMGAEGLKRATEGAVLNANYLRVKLREHYSLPHNRVCMHEFVLSGEWFKRKCGVKTLDIAKRLLDYGYHAPTIYFPLIVPEALMIEPTETESKESLDAFVEAMIAIAEEARSDPDLLRKAPHDTVVGRMDETTAARHPVIRHHPPPSRRNARS